MNVGPVETAAAFQNLRFGRGAVQTEKQLDEARSIMANWRGPGTLVIVTHSSTLKGLTGIDIERGKFIVMKDRPADLTVAAMPDIQHTDLFKIRSF